MYWFSPAANFNKRSSCWATVPFYDLLVLFLAVVSHIIWYHFSSKTDNIPRFPESGQAVHILRKYTDACHELLFF